MSVEITASFQVGGFECQVIPDGIASYQKEFMFPGVPQEVLNPMLEGRLDSEGQLRIPYNPLLVRTRDAVVLIDAGAGLELAEEWGDPIGQAVESLEAARITPSDVDIVLVTHAHPDHIGGLTVPNGNARAPMFPNARHYLGKVEWDFWLSPEGEGANPDGAQIARNHLVPLRVAGLLELVEEEAEVLPGIHMFPTPGHTPGHMSVEIASGDTRAIAAGDVLLHEWVFEHVDWYAVPETDPDLVGATRRNLLERAASEGSIVQAFHLPHVGRVEAAGPAFRFLPLHRGESAH
jgi:glyoxylase-like metal-dependent hydrolase (beta-lactamase superfamily II)